MRILALSAMALFCTVAFLSPAAAEVPRLINYQGTLTDSTGQPVVGFHDLFFRVYSDPVGGILLWEEVQSPEIDEGLFSVILGVHVGIADSLLNAPELWMEITVDDHPPVEPRMRFTSVPWALRAARADVVSELPEHDHHGAYFTKDELQNPGTVNDSINPVDWTKLKSVPPGFADGVDDGGGGGDGHSLDAADGNPVDAVYVDTVGNVGIGTTSPRVQLSLGTDLNPKKLALWDGVDDFYGLGAVWGRITLYTMNTERMTVLSNGKVGIGTSLPQQDLHLYQSDPELAAGFRLEKEGYDYYDLVSENGYLFFNTSTASPLVIGSGNVLVDKNLGIGAALPDARLAIESVYDAKALIKINQSGVDNWAGLRLDRDGSEKWFVGLTPYNDYLLFRRDGSSNDAWIDGAGAFNTAGLLHAYNDLQVDGNTQVADTLECGILQITGGSDIAEPFTVHGSAPAKPGMVMSIDPVNPGAIETSEKAYDRCVAGIVSGAGQISTGMLMGQIGSVADGDCPVAMTGRVYCHADASYGPIRPGDLLTTSDTPGHAMIVTDYGRAQGAVLGKAMSSLEEGRGLVLVLVTLQ